MAQVYSEQAKVDRTPTAPDTGALDYFEGKRKMFVNDLGNLADQTMKVQLKKEKVQKDSLDDLTKKAAIQVYKNAYSEFPDDPDTYNKTVAKGLREIYKAVPDSDDKANIMAEVQITGSGYNSKIKGRYHKKVEAIANTRLVDKTTASLSVALDNASLNYISPSEMLTPEERFNQEQAYNDARMTVENAYRQSLRNTSTGQPVFSVAQKARIKDARDNFGLYGALDYTQDNMATDIDSVVQLRKYAQDDPEGFKEDYDMNDTSLNKYLDMSDKIISRKMTSFDAQAQQGTHAENTAVVKDMEIGVDGKVNNNHYNNLNSTIEAYNKLKHDEDMGMYTGKADREKLAKEKSKVAKAIVNQVQTGVKYKGKFGFWNENVGEVAVAQVDANIADMDTFFQVIGFKEDQIAQVKAAQYIYTLEQLGDNATTKSEPDDKKRAMKVTNAAYINTLENSGIVVNVPEKYRNNDKVVRAYITAAIADKTNEYAKTEADELTGGG